MAVFIDNNGNLIEHEDKYDPETGENTAINEFINSAKQKGQEVKPIHIFQDTKGQKVFVPYGNEKKFLDLGLKDIGQVSAEKSAQEAHEKLARGDIGYTPNKTESLWGKALNSASGNLVPQATGLVAGVANKLKGGTFGSRFNEEKEAEQAAQTARENANPITSEVGNIIGSGLTLGLTGGVTSIPRMMAAGAGYNALSNIEEDINKNKPLSVGEVSEEGLHGAAEALGGGILGKGIQKVGSMVSKAGKGVLPKAIKEAYMAENLTGPGVDREIQTQAATSSKNLMDAISGIKTEIGEKKSDLLRKRGQLSHKPVIDLIDEEQAKLLKKQPKTGYSADLDSINNATEFLDEIKSDLRKNPRSPQAMDRAKQKLQDIEFNIDKPIRHSKEALKATHNVRNGIMNYLQDETEKLGGTNKGYKTILDAEDATGLKDIELSPSEVLSLGSNNPSPPALNKFDNLMNFYNKIKDNQVVDPNIKNKLSTNIANMLSISKKANISKGVANNTAQNVANQVGNLVRSTPQWVQKTAKTIYGIPESVYNNLPLEIQRTIAIYPDYAKKFKNSMDKNNEQPQN